MNAEITKNGDSARLEILSWLSKMTLDVIGLAGFNYRFDNLNPHGEPNELNAAFSEMFNPQGPRITPFTVLRNAFPILNVFVSALRLATQS